MHCTRTPPSNIFHGAKCVVLFVARLYFDPFPSHAVVHAQPNSDLDLLVSPRILLPSLQRTARKTKHTRLYTLDPTRQLMQLALSFVCFGDSSFSQKATQHPPSFKVLRLEDDHNKPLCPRLFDPLLHSPQAGIYIGN